MAEQAGTPKGGRTGGPKTVAGKSASARNATKHGLFALTPMPGPEQDALSAKVAQLTAYYRPDSPLAQLQIQRIARCATKLESLYVLEQTKIDLALLQSQTAPDQCMAHFAHYPAEARNLAKAWLSNTATKLPCKLTNASLQEVCTEIGAYFGSLENLEDLRRVFPKLRKVLEKANTGADGVPMPMDDLLWAASKIIKSYMDLQLRDPVDAADPGGQTVDRFLTSMLAKVAGAEGHRHGARPVVDPPAYQNQVFEGLNIFKTLNGFCQQAAEIVAAFPKIQSMLSASTMMPPDDSDRLMRYQTALEKQLSRYMGEFLQLQKLGPVPT